MTSITQARRRQRAKAARQALTLCEAELRLKSRISTGTARAALRAVGLPPLAAAALRGRLLLTPDLEAEK
jgi:hypothetical protein